MHNYTAQGYSLVIATIYVIRIAVTKNFISVQFQDMRTEIKC